MKIASITFAILAGVVTAGSGTPSATPAPTTSSVVAGKSPSSCIEVSVETDATYCIEGPICSGSGDTPAGTLCPVKGAVAVKDCHDNLPSWTGTGTCVAPSDVVCAKIKTGAWGCVYGTPTSTPCPTLVLASEASTPCPSLALATESSDATPCPTLTLAKESSIATVDETPCPTFALATESSDVAAVDSTPCPSLALATDTTDASPTSKSAATAAATSTPCPTLALATSDSSATTTTTKSSSATSSTTAAVATLTPCPTLLLASGSSGETASTSSKKAVATSTPCPSLPIASSSSASTSTPCPSLPIPSDNNTVTTAASTDSYAKDSPAQSITTSTTDQANGSDASRGFPTEAIVGIVGGAAAVVAIAGFAFYTKRQNLQSPSLYLGAAATPVRG
ncbi:mucin-like protein [Phytophthora cinnamomi]|uniref:mucin-like protein n=1 Tax=Phytophthora cinnamomi TaxID=4785 RepID=UPI002A297569|nr:mucin-like protein [Phytophthora cinnamomi]KAJ8550653.1 hypothetical protein ON010_g10419 [Phytophthora cinnamomi]